MAETDIVDEKPKLFVTFKPHKEKKLPSGKPSKPVPAIEIKNGHYHRKFEAKEAPFAVKDETELQMLLNTGHFVEHKPEANSDQPAAAVTPPVDAAPAKAKATKRRESKTEV